MNGHQLRTALHAGQTVYGTMTSLARSPRWAAILARLGFDYVIVDTEHSPQNRAEVAEFCLALAGAGLCPIVRVPMVDEHAVIMALDGGAQGVLVPYCESADEVRRVVAAARLRPLKGHLAGQVRDGGEWPSDATRKYIDQRNQNVVMIIGIESVPAVEQLPAILDVDGIDAIFIGPNDLSISLGVPDQYDHPHFQSAVARIVDTAAARGIPAGGHWQTPDAVQHWQARGSRFILYSSDARALADGYRAGLEAIRGQAVAEVRHTI